MEHGWDLAIIGAGAAGLAAAIFAGETAQAAGHSQRIALLDSAATIGAKILVSGGGRCNITHDEVSPDDFNGSRNIVRNVLAAFDEQATVRWFTALGVPLKREETGKLFPVSNSARTVLDALLRRCDELGIVRLTQHRVREVTLFPDARDARSPMGPLSPGGRETERGGSSGDKSRLGRTPSPSPSPIEGEGKTRSPQLGAENFEPNTIVSHPRRGENQTAREPRFLIRHERGELTARRVIMATGGRSLPRTGSDGSGWSLVRRLGHTVTDTYPALVPLVLQEQMFHAAVSGIALPVELSTIADGKVIDRRTGSLLWTHLGVSGPVVMDASRHWVVARASGKPVELRCNFFPGQRFEHVEAHLVATAKARPRVSLGKLLAEHFPDRFAYALLHALTLDPAAVLSQLSREQRRSLGHGLSNFLLPVERERGWNFAEVTAGGVPLQEIDYRTMASRKVPGLYLVGEMLDCDGRIGGFNFQWAWATGYLAGRAAAQWP